MGEIDKLFKSILERQKSLPPELKLLQEELQSAYETNYLESGVIDRGYYTSFNNVLQRFGAKYILSEEEYVENGKLIKVPIVDIIGSQDSKRLFILPKIS
jgi:hypothetical protein